MAWARKDERIEGHAGFVPRGTQISKLTDVARRHDDEIDDMRAMQDYTHELVLEREQRENKHKIIIKSWPQSAGYSDRVRVTDWLLYKAQVQDNAKQEHGYYTANKKYTLSPVTPSMCVCRPHSQSSRALVAGMKDK